MKRDMRKAACLALILFVCLVQGSRLEAQTGSVVRGRVLDQRGAPVTRIKVTVGTKWVFTDSTGRYVLSRVPPGRYTVNLERRGKRVSDQQIEVKDLITDRDLRWPF